MLQYHDRKWGVPVHDDRTHFEFLVLEAAQAGLNWSIVLKKREGYRRAFSEFDPEKVEAANLVSLNPYYNGLSGSSICTRALHVSMRQ